VDEIQQLKREGLSILAISNLTGYDRKTIRKYLLKATAKPVYGPRPALGSKLEPFKGYLGERLQAGVWNARVLLRELRSRNYQGGYTTVTEWLRPQREAAQVVAVRRFETPPGKQAQVDWGHLGSLAAAGRERVPVYAAPRVALIATGDEIVAVAETPRDFQIRNSNVYSLAAQVARAGGVPWILPVARDEIAHTRELIERGLSADLLLLSGGVSAGKYDIVEQVLEGLGAEFFFDRVLIQPGQPLVFGKARGKFFFGLPGNPSSTMVTFEIFARAALELLGGQEEVTMHMPFARLTQEFHHRVGLTRFLPARLSRDGAEVTPLAWRGSSDVPALTRANSFMVVDADRPDWQAGDWVRVLLK